MVRKDKRGVVIAAPLQLNNLATAGLPRFDDAHRGPAVTDAYELSRCYIDLTERSRNWKFPKKFPQHLEEKATHIAEDKRAEWLQLQWAHPQVIQIIANAMRTGELPIWVAPKGEREQLVAPGALVEVDKATVVSGVYRPTNDRGWLYGRPLFVKYDDWVDFATSVDEKRRHGPQAFSGGFSKGGATSTIAAERECQEWLLQEFAKDTQRKRTKDEFKTEAQAKFGPRLSQRGFLRAWDAVARQAGRSRPGRKS